MKILRQETVSRMHGIGIRYLGRAQYRRYIEITLGCAGGPYAYGFVCKPDMKRVPVDIRIYGNSHYPEFLAGSQDSYGNLAAVCD